MDFYINIVLRMKEDNQDIPLRDQVYSREEYAKPSFWDDRYAQKGGFFDWYAELPELKLAFSQYSIQTTDKILMVGCGNSKLSQQMYEAGYHDIINIDISPAVIEQMKNKYPHMVWEVMDVTDIKYPNAYFDCVMDKGTLDALISGKNYDICQGMLKDCMRVTKQSGQLILITYGSPEGRRRIFENVLQFDNYDYYQCRAELNDMSTMINLMRSNMPGKNLKSIIMEQSALTKTMKQFSILKMMRKTRKNVKQFIVWTNYQSQQPEINSAFIQPPKEESENDNDKKGKEIVQQAEQKLQKIQEMSDPKKQEQKSETFNYNPKKQPYVFVYSIRRKLVFGLQETVGAESLSQQYKNNFNSEANCYQIQGSQHLVPISISAEPQSFINILKAIKYIDAKQIQKSTIKITSQPKSNDIGLHLNLVISQKNKKIIAVRKNNITLSVQLNQRNTIEWIFKQLKNINTHLLSKANLYPCPKTYALFHVLKNRKIGPSVNAILDKYWFPTWKIQQVNQKQVIIKFSLPPVTASKMVQIKQLIQLKFAPAKLSFGLQQFGLVSLLNFDLLNIISMACLSYSNEKVDLVLDDFWTVDQLDAELSTLKKSEINGCNLIPNTVILPFGIVSQCLVHLFSLYDLQ